MTMSSNWVQCMASPAVINPMAAARRTNAIMRMGLTRSAMLALGAMNRRRRIPEEPSTKPTMVIGAPSASIQRGQMPT